MMGLDNLHMSVYLLVFMRMTGVIALNPLLTRRNVPARVRAGLAGLMTILIAPGVALAQFNYLTGWSLVTGLLRELLTGFLCGFVFQLHYYFLAFAGDEMDVEFGMSMAKVFDPGANIQMSISGNFLTLIFTLYLLATNSHHILIRIIAQSYEVVPIARGIITNNLPVFVFQLFTSLFLLAVQLVVPFVAADLILEFSMGVLMKFIPQIHVFVINIQFKMLLGISMLFLMAPIIVNFMDHYINGLFEKTMAILRVLTVA